MLKTFFLLCLLELSFFINNCCTIVRSTGEVVRTEKVLKVMYWFGQAGLKMVRG